MRGIKPLKVKLVPHTVGRVKAYWNFKTDIPEIDVVAGPLDKEPWSKRLEEEIRVFEIWRKFNKNVPFRNLRIQRLKTGEWVFVVEANLGAIFKLARDHWTELYLSVPLSYPQSPPWIIKGKVNKEFWNVLQQRKLHNYFLCIPAVERAWWLSKKGRAGVAHFLNILLFYISVATRARSKVSSRFRELTRERF